jgi:hypothetical protein
MHYLVEKIRKSIVKARTDKGCVSSGRGELDIRVSPNSLDRALRIIDSLIKKLAEKGIEVVIEEKDYKSTTRITVSEEPFAIDMYEKINIIKKEEKDWLGSNQYDYIPNGKLVLRIKNAPSEIQSEWIDGKRKKLEDQINGFIDGLYKAADREKELKRERQKWHEEYIKKEERQKIEERELAQFKILEKEALSWHTSKIIQSYIEAATAAYMKKNGKIEPGSKFDLWKALASKQADRINPLMANGITLKEGI